MDCQSAGPARATPPRRRHITRRAEKDFPTRNRELWLTGSASSRTLTELRDRGWTVHEKGLSLMAESARTPHRVP